MNMYLFGGERTYRKNTASNSLFSRSFSLSMNSPLMCLMLKTFSNKFLDFSEEILFSSAYLGKLLSRQINYHAAISLKMHRKIPLKSAI